MANYTDDGITKKMKIFLKIIRFIEKTKRALSINTLRSKIGQFKRYAYLSYNWFLGSGSTSFYPRVHESKILILARKG